MYKIYKHTNNINGFSYIGKTRNTVEERLLQHVKSKKYYFSRALNKYGVDNFSTVILESGLNEKESNIKEKYWIKYYNTFNGNGYNCTEGGDGGNCRQNYKNNSSEHNNKIGKWHEGKVTVIDIKTGNKLKIDKEEFIGNRHKYLGITEGIKKTKEHKNKISKSLKGNIPSIETRNKLSLITKGSNNPNASKINIYDSNDKLVFETHGNFKEVCKINNLPYSVLAKSYRNNGAHLYTSKMAQSKAKENIKYKDWYALKVPMGG